MSSNEEQDEERIYTVVINPEEQYSIWFAERDLPNGWRAVGATGNKKDCLAYVDKVWTDMRPLSLRTWMDARRADSVE